MPDTTGISGYLLVYHTQGVVMRYSVAGILFQRLEDAVVHAESLGLGRDDIETKPIGWFIPVWA